MESNCSIFLSLSQRQIVFLGPLEFKVREYFLVHKVIKELKAKRIGRLFEAVGKSHGSKKEQEEQEQEQ